MEQRRAGETRHENGLTMPTRPARLDVYQAVTDRILALLEKGVVPWQSPSLARVGLPRNFATGQAYRGINVFLLGSHEFQSPYFLTFRQALELGGNVRRGEHGMLIVKLGTWNPTQNDASKPEGVDVTPARFLKVYTVFNACQVDGVSFPPPPAPPVFTPAEMAQKAQQIVDAMPQRPEIHEGRKAYPHYVPSIDTVEMPSRSTFPEEWRFYKTLFHELAHATGHVERLNRKSLTENRGFQAGGAGRKIYCQEELVAEMTAAFLSFQSGIAEDDHQSSAAYLHGWMEALRVGDHRTWLVRAAADAQRAADFILGTLPEGQGREGESCNPPPPTRPKG